jgi:uncharacterized protein
MISMIAKRCIIIHGCPSKYMNLKKRYSNKNWISWATKELNKKGIKTKTPLMPLPWKPDYKKFKREFEKSKIDENTILVGHSCGASFLVRWLGESKKKIFKLILVAPWKIAPKDDEFRKKFYTYSIDKTIIKRTKEIVIFTSDNERQDGKKGLKIYKKSLPAKVIILKGKGHYTFKDMGTQKFPELIEVILE